ncbi:hypothetical protein [Nocardioides sp. R-C-SC26]|uniref:hypothetical protein n=1 Tax=Nocardioides sp. R-C-SC26 TaxID=2870414 RepID=UPI001E3A9163|nr:hypothetical protein [Nocardioides sp. R-C-SC26]
MLLLGFLLVAGGAGLIAAGLLTAEDAPGSAVQVLGIDVSPPTLFLLGIVGAALVLWGLWVVKYGAKREWRQRRDQRQLDELSEKLDRAERGRRRDLDEDEPKFS